MSFRLKINLASFILIINASNLSAQIDHLAAFSDPGRIWGNGVERIIEEAFRQCFRTRIIGGKIMNIRLPFAENNERDILLETGWDFFGSGKANPEELWPIMENLLDSRGFSEYVSALSSGREKVIIFDIQQQKWSMSEDLFDIARMKAGSYRGLPHRPYVLTSGKGIQDSDIYNYLYCIGHTGMDCSGFVWYILSWIGKQGGIDLGRILSSSLGVPHGADPSRFVGTAFFNSGSSQIIAVNDEIRSLRPGDVILFRNNEGGMAHSAVIQSINFSNGVIRYLQCTDEAPLAERGVHESFVYFDPASPNVSLTNSSLQWTQKRFAPFPGEKDSPFSDDGERYRAYGGGKVVRLRVLVPVIERLNKN
ncbi:MAG: peptidoglycan endopeptidase [Treponema sp.]|nr:peptidoglycan endopeptidase [Treponema sp.]MCL2272538.1 peptidoglycan endopeptidase [Treponema sp.]